MQVNIAIIFNKNALSLVPLDYLAIAPWDKENTSYCVHSMSNIRLINIDTV